MTTADFRKKVDAIWNVFWSGGITNPMSVIEQMTYLIYMRQLDLAQDDIDKKRAIGVPVPESQDIFNAEEQRLRWKNLIAETDPVALRNLIAGDVFDHLRNLGGTGMSKHMVNATFGIENPSTLRSVMALMNELDFRDKDFLGDLYEYLLSQLSTSGKNGQFRTTQHIIKLMVELMRPAPGDRIIETFMSQRIQTRANYDLAA